MKRRTKIIIGLSTLCAASLSLAACSVWDTPYDKLNNPVRVLYDVNGGQFASADNTNIVDLFTLEQASKGVKLSEPGSDERGKEAKTLSTASRSGYFLAGWYSGREKRADAKGTPIDDFGNPCTEEQQGYTYSGKWDFSKDVFKISEEAYDEDEVTLTLYAAWVPYYTFTFYTQEQSGWTASASYSVNPETQSPDLSLPYWADLAEGADVTKCTGAMTYGDFPVIQGKTFNKIYADSAKTDEVTGDKITHTATVDEKTGTGVGLNVDYYLDLIDGVWYHIYTAEQMRNNSRVTGCYEIYSDLDFDGVTWNAGFVTGDFIGKIIGNGHTISNVTVNQTDNSKIYGGMFGRIMASAVIKDLKFTNVTFNLNAAARLNGGQFGLFSGNINPDAEIKNVNVTGTLHIGNVFPTYNYYDVGLVCGNMSQLPESVTYDISCTVDVVKSGTTQSYPHRAEVKDGMVIISANPDPNKDPN